MNIIEINGVQFLWMVDKNYNRETDCPEFSFWLDPLQSSTEAWIGFWDFVSLCADFPPFGAPGFVVSALCLLVS